MPFTNATALYVREVEALFWTTTSAEAEAGARSHAFVQVKQKSGTSCTPPPTSVHLFLLMRCASLLSILLSCSLVLSNAKGEHTVTVLTRGAE